MWIVVQLLLHERLWEWPISMRWSIFAGQNATLYRLHALKPPQIIQLGQNSLAPLLIRQQRASLALLVQQSVKAPPVGAVVCACHIELLMPPLLCHQQLVLLPDLLHNVSLLVSLIHCRELRQNLAIDVVLLDVLWILDDVLFNHSSEEVPQLELLQGLLP